MKCRLCTKPNIAFAKSHIIPKFIYKPLKGKNNEFFDIYIKKDLTLKSNKKQNEGYDNSILCISCDNEKLGQYERSFAPIYCALCGNFDNSEKKLLKYNTENHVEFYSLTNFDFQKTCKFFLSILWRASITKLPLYNEVSLGAKHEENIRKILHDEREYCSDDYPILLFHHKESPSTLSQVILEPRLIFYKLDNRRLRAYIFYFNNLQVIIIVNGQNNKLPAHFQSLMFSKENANIYFQLENLISKFNNDYFSSKFSR